VVVFNCYYPPLSFAHIFEYYSQIPTLRAAQICVAKFRDHHKHRRIMKVKEICFCSGVRVCIQKFRTDRLEQELQMVQLSATRYSCIAILWVSLVSFAFITHCAAFQRVFIVVSLYFVIDSVLKLLDTSSYMKLCSGFVLTARGREVQWGVKVEIHLRLVCVWTDASLRFHGDGYC
jgi:hypothetical protein